MIIEHTKISGAQYSRSSNPRIFKSSKKPPECSVNFKEAKGFSIMIRTGTAFDVAKKTIEDKDDVGILICGTGIGM